MTKDLPISDGDYTSRGIGGEAGQKKLRKDRTKKSKVIHKGKLNEKLCPRQRRRYLGTS